MAMTISNNPARPGPKALAGAIEALAARFGNRLITSQAVREQHAHTTTWLPTQPPDAVVMAQETADIQDVVRICAKHGVPVIAFGTGTSLEGQVNAPAGGVCIDLRDMNQILAVHAEGELCGLQFQSREGCVKGAGCYILLGQSSDELHGSRRNSNVSSDYRSSGKCRIWCIAERCSK